MAALKSSMRVHCPICGPRDLGEFSFGGDAAVLRPRIDDEDAERWYRYVYARDNPRGVHPEYWQHAGGCRHWLRVHRDTVTHRIHAVELVGPWVVEAGAARPDIVPGE